MILLVNFGGPRDLKEVTSFLIELLSDPDLIQTPLPRWLHRKIFSKVARRRSEKVSLDYAAIGGGSPIFQDTETLASLLESALGEEVVPFHRYLIDTHPAFLKRIERWRPKERILAFPLFPQFSYATTGSVARFFARHLSGTLLDHLTWIPSYPDHPAYIRAFSASIAKALTEHQLSSKRTLLLFSAHGVPQSYVNAGDPYQNEIERSFAALRRNFPQQTSRLSYQSQFGSEVWTQPYTKEVCQKLSPEKWDHVLFLPLSFTSDHIETLFEVENDYMPLCADLGITPYRCSALTHDLEWIEAILEIIKETPRVQTGNLIR